MSPIAPPGPWATAGLIFVGAGLGANLRYWLGGWIAGRFGGFPWGTLAVNLTGCLAMGCLAAWLERGSPAPWARPLLAVGLLGGYTTFSAFSAETLALWQTRGFAPAAGYFVATNVSCLLGAYLGHELIKRIAR